jgi:hypothetical protein
MPEERLRYILQLDGDKDYARRMKTARQATEKESKGMVDSFKGIGTAVKAFVGLAIVQQVGRGVLSLATLAEKTRVVEASFQRLAAGVGQNFREILTAINRGSQGTVSNLEAMRQANQAILLGLPVTSKQMGELAEVALRLGRAVGRTAQEGLGDLITGFGRMSPLILDNLGITIKAEEAYDKYASKLGKTADQLTEAEKKQAFFTEGMEKARAKAAELGGVTGGLNDKWSTFKVRVENAAVSVGQRLIPMLENLIDTLSNVVIAAGKAAAAIDSVQGRGLPGVSLGTVNVSTAEEARMRSLLSRTSSGRGLVDTGEFARIRAIAAGGTDPTLIARLARESSERGAGRGEIDYGIRDAFPSSYGSPGGIGKRIDPSAIPGSSARIAMIANQSLEGENIPGTVGELLSAGFKSSEEAAKKSGEQMGKDLDKTLKQVAEKGNEQLTQMTDPLNQALLNIQGLVGTKGRGITGGIFQARAGLSNLGVKTDFLKAFSGPLNAIGGAGLALQGAAGILKGVAGFFKGGAETLVYGQTPEEQRSVQEQEEIRKARLALGETWRQIADVQKHPEKYAGTNTLAALQAAGLRQQQELSDLLGQSSAGSTQVTTTVTATFDQMASVISLMETDRISNQTRNELLRRQLMSLQNIEVATTAANAANLLRFQAIS